MEEITDRAANMILDLADIQRTGLLRTAIEDASDGYLEVKFHDHTETHPFRLIKGWRLEHGWLRIFFKDHNVSHPFHHIKSVKCMYNSKDAQDSIARTQKNHSTDSFSCLKCGGEIS